MRKIKQLFRKISYILKHDFFSIENTVLFVAIILCFVWTFQSITAMSRNWELSERLSSERRQLELLGIELETAELENEYLKTDEYQELVARSKLDKKLPGENMVVMPSNSDEAKNKHKISQTSTTVINYSNLEKWQKFLFPEY